MAESKQSLTIRLKPKLRARLDAQAGYQDRSLAWIVEKACEMYVDAHPLPKVSQPGRGGSDVR